MALANALNTRVLLRLWLFRQYIVFLGDLFLTFNGDMPGLPVQRVLHHQLFFSFQGFVQGLQDSRLWRKGIIRMSMIVIVFWSGVIWERARMGLDNITFLWLLPFPLPEYNPSQIWPSPLNCQHHTIFYVTYTNRMEKTKYLAKFWSFFFANQYTGWFFFIGSALKVLSVPY